jgi:hypothetical protein
VCCEVHDKFKVVRIALLTIVLMTMACRGRSAAERAEVARLRAEQAELKARIAALEQRAATLAAGPPANPPAREAPAPLNDQLPKPQIVAPPAIASPSSIAAPPTFVPPSSRESSIANGATAGEGLAVEDLHGRPPSSTAEPALTGAGGIPEAQAQPVLDELNRQLELFKAKQAEQQAALDALEKLR